MDSAAILLLVQSLSWWQVLISLIILIGLPNINNIVNWFRKRRNKKNPHINCRYYKDLDNLINKRIEIYAYKTYKTLDRQMSLADKTVLKIKNILLDDYKNLTSTGRDFRFYSEILGTSLEVSKQTLKQWIKNNHILEKSDDEFRTYVKETADLIQNNHVHLLDGAYFDEDFTVGRGELYKYNKEHNMEYLHTLIIDLLYAIRNIAREDDKIIKELEDE